MVDANEAALEAMGATSSQLLGTPLWEAPAWRASDQLPTDIRAAVAAVASGAFVRFEAVATRPGSAITLDLFLKRIGGAADAPLMILVEGRDVGARAEAERALRDSEERFNRIVSIAADAIISMDEDQRVTMFNSGAEKIFGYTASEIIGRPLEMLLPTGVDDRHAAAVRQFAAGTIDARHMGERREIFGRRKSGEVFRADASISKVPVAGRVVFTAVVRDVTDRWTREQERARLLEAATRAHADADHERERMSFLAHVSGALNASLDYGQGFTVISRLLVPRFATVCVVDVIEESGAIRRIDVFGGAAGSEESAEVLRGYTLRRDRPYLTKRALESGHSELVAEVTNEFLESIAPTEQHAHAFRALGMASLVCVPLVARGSTLGAIALGRDGSMAAFGPADQRLCEEIALRAALALDNARLYRNATEAVRQRDSVLGVVSHDLRNPLSAIGMCVTGLEQAPGGDAEERSELLSAIRDSVDWAQGLIADLLDIASIESGRLSFEARPIDPVLLIARAAHFFDPAAREKAVRLTTTAPDDTPAVMADERRTLQVLSNLVSNALKHTPAGGHVTVTAQPEEREVVFSVADNGPGIPATEVPRLFDRFWHARRGGEQAGTGLGLAIAKGIVDAHGGSIWVETEVGVGSTFKFSLPRSSPPPR